MGRNLSEIGRNLLKMGRNLCGTKSVRNRTKSVKNGTKSVWDEICQNSTWDEICLGRNLPHSYRTLGFSIYVYPYVCENNIKALIVWLLFRRVLLIQATGVDLHTKKTFRSLKIIFDIV